MSFPALDILMLAQTTRSTTGATTTAGGDAAGDRLTVYRLARLEQFDDPRVMWGLVAVVAVAAVVFVAWMYRRESAQLPRGASFGLGALRLIALLGAIVFYLGPIRRTDQQVVAESRVAVLVDASQSMAVEDESASGTGKAESRSAAAIAALKDSPILKELRRQHQVTVSAFDAEVRRAAGWKRGEGDGGGAADAKPQAAGGEEAGESKAAAGGDWSAQLSPLGSETRLGDALASALGDQSGGPLAGVIVLSDGGQTGGVDPLAESAVAAEAGLPVVAVGFGSTDPRRNVRIQELIAPPRAFPRDKAMIRALVQGEQFAGRSVDVELYAREAGSGQGASNQGAAVRIGRQTVAFDEARQTVQAEFEIEPAAAGRLELEARIVAPPDDQYAEDNERTAEVDVVEASTKVLLVASGATRDYRFLRDQLRRDEHATVDVLLQNALPGISQDADKILDEFPSTREALFDYDAIVAFDPDWTQLDAGQVDLLEEWVAQEAGGMIVVAGPIYTSQWVQSPEHGKLRALYPVEFQQRLTLLDDGLFGSKTPWPIQFTREGLEADFLWLGDTPDESRANWDRFPGVFGCYAVKGAKPGATVYGRYGDPDAGISVDRPVYLAEQFYGAGRVFYIGSGELWRLRAIDPGFFEKLTTQLVRHVSEGRLLRGSSLGRLLAERDRYFVGDTVVLRAQLSTASREPFVAPQVTARVAGPGGLRRNVELAADPTRPGNYIGQFTASAEGSYRIELSAPDAPDEILSKRITAAVPDLEFADTRRNEQLLRALASRTGGRYYATVQQAVAGGGSELPPLGQLIPSRAETKILRGKPDEEFTKRVNFWLLGVICGALSCEWLGRRLLRLA